MDSSKVRLCFWSGDPRLDGYTYANMASDDFYRGVMPWKSRLQKCVALSINEVEYIAAIEESKELL